MYVGRASALEYAPYGRPEIEDRAYNIVYSIINGNREFEENHVNLDCLATTIKGIYGQQ
jgi:hypothetical protein